MAKKSKFPVGAGILVTATTILGWLGCNNLSDVVDHSGGLVERGKKAVSKVKDLVNDQNPTIGNVPQTYSNQNYPGQYYPNQGNSNQGYPGQSNPAQTNGQYQNGQYQTQQVGYSTNPNTAPTITIGTFNIQVLGVQKMSHPGVVDILVDIIRRVDVIAIQELRAKEQWIIPSLVQLINNGGYNYGYAVGPRQGHTSSKEQYVFIFDKNKIQQLTEPFVVQDSRQRMHRDPVAVSFRCITPNPQQGFSFTLMNLHTDPQMTRIEMDAMADLYAYARQVYQFEDDIIVLGDFNEGADRFGKFGGIPNLLAVVPPEVTTNTIRKSSYDNIVFDRFATAEYRGRFGVFDFMKHYNLNMDQAKQVSDHMPVWAIFSAYEATQNVANQNGAPGQYVR